MKLYEFADDFRLPQHLRYPQNQIRGSHSFAHLTVQVNANDVGREDINRLAQHRRLCLDAADAPTHDSQTIDHGRVRVGAYQSIRIIDAKLFPDRLRQILEIHLMADTYAGRHYAKTIKTLRAPLEKLVARVVALKLHLHVLGEGVAGAGKVHLY